jgi:hypothetical protein
MLKRVIESLRKQAKADKSMKRILKIAPNRQERRLYPSHTSKHDAKNNFRIDQGGPVHGRPGVYKVVLQGNKEAKSRACREFIKKYGTHHVIATAEVSEQDQDLGVVINALVQNALDNNFGVGKEGGKK